MPRLGTIQPSPVTRARHSHHQRGSLTARAAVLVPALLVLAAMGCDKGDGSTKVTDTAEPSAEQAKPGKHGLTPEQAKQVVAKVGDRVITLGEFADNLASQSPYLRARYQSPERRREFLENMIRFELLSLEAKDQGLDQRPDVQRVRRQVMVQQMMKKLFDEDGVKLSDITDEEIAAYYEAHRSEFIKPAQLRASVVLIKDKATAQRVFAEARKDPSDMAGFRKLAAKHNTHATTKARAGDLGFFYADASLPDQPAVPEVVREAAFDMSKVGSVYERLLNDDAGYYIVKLTGKRAALERSLEDAARLIQNRLWRERRSEAIEAFVAELRKKANVKEDLTLLKSIQVEASKANAAHGAQTGEP